MTDGLREDSPSKWLLPSEPQAELPQNPPDPTASDPCAQPSILGFSGLCPAGRCLGGAALKLGNGGMQAPAGEQRPPAGGRSEPGRGEAGL